MFYCPRSLAKGLQAHRSALSGYWLQLYRPPWPTPPPPGALFSHQHFPSGYTRLPPRPTSSLPLLPSSSPFWDEAVKWFFYLSSFQFRLRKMWSAVTRQKAMAAPSLPGLGVSQPLTAEIVLGRGDMEGTSQPLCVPSTLILITWPPPAFLGKRSGSRIKQNWVGSGLTHAYCVTLGRFCTSLSLLVSSRK